MAGNVAVPVKFGPKGTDPNRKDARFTFHTRRAVQSAIADLVVYFMFLFVHFLAKPRSFVRLRLLTASCEQCYSCSYHDMIDVICRYRSIADLTAMHQRCRIPSITQYIRLNELPTRHATNEPRCRRGNNNNNDDNANQRRRVNQAPTSTQQTEVTL